MSEYNKSEKLSFYDQRKVSSGTIWLLFLFFGWSYGSMNQIGKQLFYYLTLGGCGLWAIYLLFTLNGKILNYNYEIAKEVGLSDEDLNMLGLKKNK